VDFPIDKTDYNSTVAFFADDTGLLIKSKNADNALKKMQRKVPHIETWCKKWKILINTTKSNLLMLRPPKTKMNPHRDIYMFKEKIPKVKSATLLGLTINDKLTWADHIKKSQQRQKECSCN